ncbi:MFS transporter [Nocardioides taihuensis]|uniref:MFS transporter n=1 Tax=Nocardioides taihuensis TaxID=1835606 RepID=A0ABW0BM73_9ACTN
MPSPHQAAAIRPRLAHPRTWGRTTRAVAAATACALGLHVVWVLFLAGTGGDLAAQDAWTGFALAHPSSAYDFAWYGGMHPASYSLIAPYLMSVTGVRTTAVVVGTVSAALLALIVSRGLSVSDPTRVGIYGAVALFGNAVSGRVTFGLGVALGLGALAVVFAWPRRPAGDLEQWCRGALVALLAGLATAASPVAGLFLGLVAAALWLRGRRRASLAVGTVPVVVVAVTAVLFPFAGIQPTSFSVMIAPLLLAAAAVALLPRQWRLVRACCAVYGAAILLAWVFPTPIGTNIVRMALLFGGVALAAAASGAWWTSPVARRFGRPVARALLVTAIASATVWQVVIAGRDLQSSAAAASIDVDVSPLVAELEARGADAGRVEVVPTKSHREASALSPYVNLARGWNRQEDVHRNAVFYGDEGSLTPERYEHWLHRWAVRFVVLPDAPVDYAGEQEAALVRAGLPFLREVWQGQPWTLYEVVEPTPLASAPASVVDSDASGVTVHMPEAGSTVVRVAWSPWLSIVDDQGRRLDATVLGDSCIDQAPGRTPSAPTWAVLRVTEPGTYRVGAPYALPRGTPCPDVD